jgi:hypothetical protein
VHRAQLSTVTLTRGAGTKRGQPARLGTQSPQGCSDLDSTCTTEVGPRTHWGARSWAYARAGRIKRKLNEPQLPGFRVARPRTWLSRVLALLLSRLGKLVLRRPLVACVSHRSQRRLATFSDLLHGKAGMRVRVAAGTSLALT